MTWIKLNDNVPRHPKVARLSDRAFRRWIQGICYASEFLTDGVLPEAFLCTVSHRDLTELVEAGLWRVPEDGRVLIHDYLDHQSSKEVVSQRRAEAKGRVARHRRKPVENSRCNAVGNASVTDPDTDTDTETDSPLRPPRGKTKTKMTRFVSLGARRKDPHAN